MILAGSERTQTVKNEQEKPVQMQVSEFTASKHKMLSFSLLVLFVTPSFTKTD